MTRVRIRRNDGELDLEVTGHAGGYGPDDDSRVCAAASMLVCAMMERLERARDEMTELHVGYKPGRAEIYARAGGDAKRTLEESAAQTLCGFELLAAAFPRAISIDRG